MENTENNQPTPEVNAENKFKLSLPAAIVVAGVLIAGSIFMTKAPAPGQEGSNYNTAKLAKVSEADHIFGAGPENKIFLVEYSDLECPFCQVFHETANKIVDEYGGQVAWVYRHYPLPFHDKAPKEAEATECAAELGGNDAFWKYIDRIFEVSPTNNGLNPAELYNIAAYLGLDATAFRTCLDSGKHEVSVQADIDNATEVGVSGTPSSFLVYKKKIVPIEGAEPYESVKAKIDALLK